MRDSRLNRSSQNHFRRTSAASLNLRDCRVIVVAFEIRSCGCRPGGVSVRRCAGRPARANFPKFSDTRMTGFLFHLLSALQRAASSVAEFAASASGRVWESVAVCLAACARREAAAIHAREGVEFSSVEKCADFGNATSNPTATNEHQRITAPWPPPPGWWRTPTPPISRRKPRPPRPECPARLPRRTAEETLPLAEIPRPFLPQAREACRAIAT